jgi:agmatine/peptidylarginine deiminase
LVDQIRSCKSFKNYGFVKFIPKNMILQAFCLFLAFLHQETSASTSECDSSKQLVVAVLPDNEYYKNSFPDIEYFIEQMAQGTRGLDHFIVLYSEDWDNEFYEQGYDSVYGEKRSIFGLPFGDNTLRIVSNYNLDLWARDFGLVGPAGQVKFTYLPEYLKPKDAEFSDAQFNGLLKNLGIKVTHSDIVLDGGNVVDNNWGKAIISERILEENKGKTKQELQSALENLLNMSIAFIADPDDTTGHSDGIVSFIEDDVVLIGDYNDPEYYTDVENSIKTAYPDVKTVRLGCKVATSSATSDKNWRGFSSAVGSYVNILVTNNAAYVPQFGKPKCDKKALDLVKANTDKTVVPIDTSKLSHMGGSVRCMTYQVETCNPVAKRLLKEARKMTNGD